MASEAVAERRFFVLKAKNAGPYDTGCRLADGFATGEAPTCPRCHKLVGMREVLPPLRMELEVHGQRCGDLMISAGGDAVVSEPFADAFRLAGLSGALGFEPVELVKVARRKTGRESMTVPRYFLMRVCFARATIDETRSLLRRSEPVECLECRETGIDGIYGFRVEPRSWGGEDILRPRGLTSLLVVSERFAQMVKDHALTNIELIPTEQYRWDPGRKGPPAPAVLA